MNVVIVCEHGSIIGGAPKLAIGTAIALTQSVGGVGFFAGTLLGPELAGSSVRAFSLGLGSLDDVPPSWRPVARAAHDKTTAESVKRFISQYDPRNTVVHVHQYGCSISGQALEAVHQA